MSAQAVEKWTLEQIASVCDHTYLARPEQFKSDMLGAIDSYHESLVDFSVELEELPLHPYAVCVRPEEVEWVMDVLSDAGFDHLVVCSVVGFPCGNIPTQFKTSEARLALAAGAQEIDMVLDQVTYHRGDLDAVARDVSAVAEVTHQAGGVLKLILEISELSLDQIKDICQRAAYWGVDMVKTSTGFSSSGATVEAVKVMAQNFEGGIKISGGVRLENVRELLSAVEEGRGKALECDPNQIRIGESSLLKELLT